jgi:putative hydrolase of HD superfamily
MTNLMIPEGLRRQVEFLKELEKLKLVKRANRTLDSGRFENSAEHSWHVALMAVILSQHSPSNIDLLKVVKMLLIHDVVEIDAGDTWLYSPDAHVASQTEAVAAERLFGILPLPQRSEFIALWREFEARATDEAKFASSIDGIQPLLNHLMTGDPEKGTIALEKVRAKKEYIRSSAPELWGLVEMIIESSTAKGLYR